MALERHAPLKRGRKGLRRTPLGHASPAQKSKVEREGCRMSYLINSHGRFQGVEPVVVDPAHITPRAIGGCDDELCVVPLTRFNHLCYDRGELDILPHLTLEEQAHAVSHMGILAALKRTTGDEYITLDEAQRRFGDEDA